MVTNLDGAKRERRENTTSGANTGRYFRVYRRSNIRYIYIYIVARRGEAVRFERTRETFEHLPAEYRGQ